MDLLPSLCAAMMRTGGDSLILREGSPPHVIAGATRHDVARAVLSHNAVEALVLQIFSEASRRTFQETDYVVEVVRVIEPSLVVTATAERLGDELRIELVRQPSQTMTDAPVGFAPELQLAPADDEPEADVAEEPLPTLEELALEPATLDLARAADAPDNRTKSLTGPPRDWASVLSLTPRSESIDDALASAPAIPTPPSVLPRKVAPAPLPVSVPDDMLAPATAPTMESARPAAVARQAVPASPMGGRNELVCLTERAAAMGASALFLRADSPVMARVDGKMVLVQSGTLSGGAFAGACAELEGGANSYWRKTRDGSWTHDDARTGRVTCRTFADDLGAGVVAFLETPAPALSRHRLIPRKVKSACDGDGLLVISGSTPADVLALGAATADWASQRRGGYVIALRPAGSPRPQITGDFVSQRELGTGDVEVAAAIRAAAAESPDVLLVGAVPSDNSIREVIHAADGGRLVLVGMLAQTSIQALRLIAGHLQAGGDAPNRLALATSFRAAFSHRVLRRLRGGHTLVQDLILGTSEVSALLASGDLAGVTRLQRTGTAGMSTVDATLARAVTRGHLSLRQAAGQAVDRAHMVASVRSARRARRAAARATSASRHEDEMYLPVGTGSGAGRQPGFAR